MPEDDNIRELKEIYRKNGICLGLGAGVSVDSGIPLWNDLLRKISKNIFENDKIFETFLNKRFSYEAFASFLKISINTNKPFTEIVREELYRNFKEAIDSSNEMEIVNYVNKNNLTLRSIGSFCAFKNLEEKKYTSNPRVHGIINFNIDRLLRVYTTAKFKRNILRTVERASAGRTHGKINVYHVHGMMRFDVNKNLDDESPDNLVLSEDEYYELFNNPTNIFNYSFLYLLREYSFLFVGLSMQDLNLRRLLYLSNTEISEGYIKEKIVKIKLQDKLMKTKKHFAILQEPRDKLTSDFHEKTLSRLGVKVIWVNTYAEIEDKLKEIYSATGNWETVY
jgi:SIR2-like domain